MPKTTPQTSSNNSKKKSLAAQTSSQATSVKSRKATASTKPATKRVSGAAAAADRVESERLKPMPAVDHEANPSVPRPEVPHGDRHQMVQEAAYHLAEKDGFQPGQEDRYWLEAERQVTALWGSNENDTKNSSEVH